MAYRLTVSDRASLEIGEAYEWYQEQRPGLGVEFIEADVTAVTRGVTSGDDRRDVLCPQIPGAVAENNWFHVVPPSKGNPTQKPPLTPAKSFRRLK